MDCGSEFQGPFAELCNRYRINREFGASDTPRSNGWAGHALAFFESTQIASFLSTDFQFGDV